MANHLNPSTTQAKGSGYLKLTILFLLSCSTFCQDPTTKPLTTPPASAITLLGPTTAPPPPPGDTTYKEVELVPGTTEEGAPAVTESSLANCKLEVLLPKSVKENFIDEDERRNLIYANLEFENVDLDPQTGYLSRDTKYVTPLRWALASGRRGILLVQFPANYQSLSLGSLSADVLSTSMSVNTDACPQFTSGSDDAKQTAVAKALLEAFNLMTDTGPVDFKVCQEIAHLPEAFAGDKGTVMAFLLNIYFIIYNTHHKCWTHDDDGALSVEIFRPPKWLTIPVVILGILGAVILPLQLLRFVQRTNSPYCEEDYEEDDKGNRIATGKVNKFYHRLTNLPVGAKYVIFTYSSTFAVTLRLLVTCVLVYIMLCPDVFFQLDAFYYERYDAFYRNNFIKMTNVTYHVARALVLLLPLLWFLPTLPSIFRHEYKLRRFRFKNPTKTVASAPYYAEYPLERSFFGLFALPHVDDHIPSHALAEIQGVSCLYYYMLQRIKTALRMRLLVSIYVHAFKRIWNGIITIMWPSDFSTLWNVMSAFACVLTLATSMPIVAAFNLLRLVFSAFLYLLPSAYILLCITNTHYLIISFVNWAYKASILDRLSRLSDHQTSHVALATEDVAMDTVEGEEKKKDDSAEDKEEGKEEVKEEGKEEGKESKNKQSNSPPKQTVVSFRGGSSNTDCVEEVEGTSTKPEDLYITKWLPLSRFYSSLYQRILPADDDGICPGLFLKIIFVIIAFMMSVLLLVIILIGGFVIFTFLSFVLLLLSTIFIIYLLRILALCTLLSSIMVLSFCGLVINSLSVIPFCLLGLTLLGYIIGAWSGLSKSYTNMHQTTIKIAKEVRPELCFVLVKKGKGEGVSSGEGEEDAVDNIAPSGDDEADMEVMEQESLVRLSDRKETPTDIEADVMVEEKLFWHVVEQVSPLRVQVMSIVITTSIAILAAIVAIIVLVDIGELQDFQAFGVNLVVLVVTLVFTQISSLISVSKEEEEEDFRLGVRNAVVGFKEDAHVCK